MPRYLKLLLMLGILAVAFVAMPIAAHAQTVEEAMATAEEAASGLNMAWTLIAGFLVFFMQLGFAFLGAGLIRSKNTVNYMTKSFMDFCIASLGFWAFGFAIMFGGSALWPGLAEGNTFIGYSGFFLSGESYDAATAMGWFFQMVFAATAATIVAGAVAERMKVTAYLAYSFILGALIYPVYGHWVWGGGWLGTLAIGDTVGVRDFAGSGVVHAVGGMAALVGAWMVGPRIGKFTDGRANTIRGHNLPFVAIGTFILFFGWFGFNPGSTLSATDSRIAMIAVNTFLAGAVGAIVALYWTFLKTGKMDIIMACNGALVGLVAITAPCAYVAPWAAVAIGALAVPVLFFTAFLVEKVLKVDDAVGAVPVHLGGGVFGLIAVGVFADGTYGGVSGLVAGNASQLVLQLIDSVVVIAWTGATAFLLFFGIKKTIGLRASRAEELGGLDIPEHGIEAYPLEPAAPRSTMAAAPASGD